jgi:Trypsin-co-occurring domain 1
MAGGTDSVETRTKLIPFRMEDGTVIHIEATRLAGGESEESEEEYIALHLPSFEEITGTIRSIAKSMVGVWQEVQPSKAGVEFSIEVGFEAGSVTAMLVKGSGKANLKVTLEWENHAGTPK